MALHAIPIRKAGARDTLFLGGDRELVMVTALLASALVFTAQEWMAALYGGGLWGAALWLLRKMAKADPKMRQVYRRQLQYKTFYPARSTPFRINRRDFQ